LYRLFFPADLHSSRPGKEVQGQDKDGEAKGPNLQCQVFLVS